MGGLLGGGGGQRVCCPPSQIIERGGWPPPLFLRLCPVHFISSVCLQENDVSFGFSF